MLSESVIFPWLVFTCLRVLLIWAIAFFLFASTHGKFGCCDSRLQEMPVLGGKVIFTGNTYEVISYRVITKRHLSLAYNFFVATSSPSPPLLLLLFVTVGALRCPSRWRGSVLYFTPPNCPPRTLINIRNQRRMVLVNIYHTRAKRGE